jgi:hypothetical protein
MGMDVYGRNPIAPEGKYFRASIDQWPVLVEVVKRVCPKERWNCVPWEYNAGDGLNGDQALALAEALESKIRSGAVALALCDPAISNATLPVVTRIQAWSQSQGLEMLPLEPNIDEQFVAEFAAFMRASGGFSIW